MPFAYATKQPLLMPGMTVGLMGGTYDPPHTGHLYFANRAIQSRNFHRVMLLISNNPLKKAPFQDLAQRFSYLKKMRKHPRISVCVAPYVWAFENMRFFKNRYPFVRFVWLMGADSLENIHQWYHWKHVIREMPILVFPRNGYNHNLYFSRVMCCVRSLSSRSSRSSQSSRERNGKNCAQLRFLRGCVEQKASSTLLREHIHRKKEET